MTTAILTKKDYIELMTAAIADEEYVIISNTPCGTFSAPTKKIKGFVVGFMIAHDVFEGQSLSPIMKSKCFSITVTKKELLSKQILERLQ